MPLTHVWGNNTLHAESEPGKGDYRPFECVPGQFVRFDGAACRHFAPANDTGATRVSFDLRAVPLGLWRDCHLGLMGDYQTKVILPTVEPGRPLAGRLPWRRRPAPAPALATAPATATAPAPAPAGSGDGGSEIGGAD